MKKRYFTTFELILLALFSALVVVAKIALRLPLKLSGHSGLFWMAIVIVAAGVVPKRGAASLVGLTSGLLAAFLGMGDLGALNTFLSYTCSASAPTWRSGSCRTPRTPVAGRAGGRDRPYLQAARQVGAGHDHRRADRLCLLGTGLVVGQLYRLGGLGRHPGRAHAQALRKAGFFAYLAEKR